MKEEHLFHQALEQPEHRRASFLDSNCGGDADLRQRVEVLLRAHANPGSFLNSPAHGVSMSATLAMPALSERPGQTIGRYKLLEEIGEGGMGVVYLAEQREPVRRRVALKIIKPGMDTREVIARFEAERQALAMMDHPNIARILDGGATESGRPYFVMELVQGLPITAYCDQANLTTRERLALFSLVCQAVQHAHQKGIIHRDIKPSNVMVTLDNDVPVPKVIDFGVAKAIHQPLTEKTLFTGQGRTVGTPMYMSPEQADMSGLDVDTRSDVYSLGVLLYELLTGSTPFDRERLREAGFDEIRRVIREEEPPRPSHRLSTLNAEAMSTVTAHRGVDARRLGRLLRGDLDWIVMKALEKDRTRRYESASALAADIERHLANEPIEARPPTLADRAAKWARRHRPVVWSAVAVLLVAVIASLVSTALIAGAYDRETTQRHLAEEQKSVAQEQERLARKQQRLAEEAAEQERRLRAEADRQRERAESLLLALLQDLNPVGAVFGRDGNLYVASYDTSAVMQFNGPSGRFMGVFVQRGSGGLDRPEGLAFGPDANKDGIPELYVASGGGNEVLRYDGASGAFLDRFVSRGSGGLSKPTDLLFGPDGKLYVASFNTNTVLRYDGKTGKFLDEFVPRGRGGLASPQGMAFGHDGNLYVASPGTHSVLRYDGRTGEFLNEFVSPRSGGLDSPEGLAFGPNGNLYVLSGGRGPASVLRYHGATGAFLGAFVAKGAGRVIGAQTVVFGPTGDLYVTGFDSNSVARYNGVTGDFVSDLPYDRRKLLGTLSAAPAVDLVLAEKYVKMAGFHLHRKEFASAQDAIDNAIARLDRLLRGAPNDLGLRTLLGNAYLQRSRVLVHMGASDHTSADWKQAIADLEKAVELQPEDSERCNNAAWYLVACPDRRLWKPARAIELAKQAVSLTPKSGTVWNTLGAARYRAGDYKAAIEALAKAMELRRGGDALDWFFLAMAHGQLKNEQEARQWYDKAVAWMEKNKPDDEELSRFRAEAADLLGNDKTPPVEKEKTKAKPKAESGKPK